MKMPILLAAALFFGCSLASAQIDGCSNSVNLVTNGNFNAPLAAGQSDFVLQTILDPLFSCIEGEYLIEDSISNKCNNWPDSTGDGDFLILDSRSIAGNASTVLWRQNISGVVIGRTYTLALDKFDIYNATEGLIVRINGNTINTNFAENGPRNTWLHSDMTWTATVGGTILLELAINDDPNTNDCAIDNVFFGHCVDCDINAEFDYAQNEKTCEFHFYDQSSSPGGGSTIVSYFWTFGDGTSSNLASPAHTYLSNGVFEVCLTTYAINSQGECCYDTYCREVESYCEFRCELKSGFEVDGGEGCAFDFTATPISATPILGYYWDFGDGHTSTQANPSHQYAASGSYEVCLIIIAMSDEGCCTDKYCIEINCETTQEESSIRLPSGLEENGEREVSEKINLFPNPNDGNFSVLYINPDSESSNGEIAVFDNAGKKVLVVNDRAELQPGNNVFTIRTGSLTPGVYTLSIRSGDQVQTRRFVIR